jgi:hypothetical protein
MMTDAIIRIMQNTLTTRTTFCAVECDLKRYVRQ